jgi:acyl carrier protein phosphodiesterase
MDVNFFGHLVLARRTSRDPEFLLGAMLPDLAELAGVARSLPPQPSAAVGAGVDHHHRADAAFHANPAFFAMVSAFGRTLQAAGVPRGGARGAAHVSVELLLDGVLSDDAAARRDFALALPVPLVFSDEDAAQRWSRMRQRLAASAVPAAYADPDFVCDRVVGALSRRPRLALGPADEEVLRAHLPELRDRVWQVADALVAP